MPHLSFSHCRWCTKFIKHKVEMSLNLHIDDSWWFDSLWAGSSAGDGGGEVRCCFQRWPPLTWHWWSLHPHQPHIGNHCLRRLTVVPWKPLTSTLMHVMCMSLPVKLDLENSRGMPPDFYAEPKINGGIVIISRRWQDKLTRLKCFCLVFSELELHRSRRAVYDFPFRSCIGNKRLLNFLFIWFLPVTVTDIIGFFKSSVCSVVVTVSCKPAAGDMQMSEAVTWLKVFSQFFHWVPSAHRPPTAIIRIRQPYQPLFNKLKPDFLPTLKQHTKLSGAVGRYSGK